MPVLVLVRVSCLSLSVRTSVLVCVCQLLTTARGHQTMLIAFDSPSLRALTQEEAAEAADAAPVKRFVGRGRWMECRGRGCINRGNTEN